MFQRVYGGSKSELCDASVFEVNNLMEQSPFRESDDRSTGQEVNHVLWSHMLYYRVHSSPPVDPILSQMNLVS
jgi:hypothetical protein